MATNRCVEELKTRLKDPDSYREESPAKVIQEVKGQPRVYSWRFNAKNSFGGYGNGEEALCFVAGSNVSLETFEDQQDTDLRRNFLALTNPELRRETEKENADAVEASTVERNKRIKILKKRCEAAREQFNKGYGSAYLCSQYFVDGSFMESDIQDIQYMDEYINAKQ